ncbi:O-antigen ligase family protein [Patescibacteria group bacterium]|nr:O-antigen ligase family protein [Patescibacteria group bacterium]
MLEISKYFLLFGPFVLASVIVLEHRMRNIPLPKQKSLLPLIWFSLLVWLAVAIPFSWSPGWSAASFFRVASYALLTLLAGLLLRDRKDVRSLSYLLVATVLFLLAHSYLFLLPGIRTAGGALSLIYARHGHSHIADALLLVTPLVFALSLKRKGKIWALLFPILLASFFFSFSRAGLVVVFFSLIVTIFLLRKSVNRRQVLFLSLLGLAILLFLSLPAILDSNQAMVKRHPWLYRQVFKPTSATRRLAYWGQAVRAFGTRPLTGTGPGTFRLISQAEQKAPGDFSWFAHNWYLQTLVESGVIGFFLWSSLFFILFRRAFRATGVRRSDPYFVGLFVGVLASSVHSFFDFDWEFPGVFLSFLVILFVLQNFSAKPTLKPLNDRLHYAVFFLLSTLLVFAGVVSLLSDVYWTDGNKIKSLRLNPLNSSRILNYVRSFGPCCDPFFSAFSLHPRLAELYEVYGYWFAKQADYSEALAYYKRALSFVSIGRPDLVLTLADISEQLGERQKQYALLERYVGVYTNMPGEFMSGESQAEIDIFNSYIRLSLSRGDYDPAFDAFSALISPRRRGSHIYLAGGFIERAELLIEQGRLEEGMGLLRRYFALAVPEDDRELFLLDKAHRKIGEVAFLLSRHASNDAEKEHYLQQALRLDPWQSEYYIKYGDLLEPYARTAEEKIIYERCLSLLPQDYHCRMRLDRLP